MTDYLLWYFSRDIIPSITEKITLIEAEEIKKYEDRLLQQKELEIKRRERIRSRNELYDYKEK